MCLCAHYIICLREMPRLFLHDSREAMQDSGSLCAACRCLRHEILSVALDEPGLHGPAHGLAGIIADAGSIAEGIEHSGLGLHAAELGIAEEDRDHLLARDGEGLGLRLLLLILGGKLLFLGSRGLRLLFGGLGLPFSLAQATALA